MRTIITPLATIFFFWFATQPLLTAQNETSTIQRSLGLNLEAFNSKNKLNDINITEAKSQDFDDLNCPPEYIIPEVEGWIRIDISGFDLEYGLGNWTQPFFGLSPSNCINTIWTGGFVILGSELVGTNQHLSSTTIQIPADADRLCFEYLAINPLNLEPESSYSFIRINGMEVFTVLHKSANDTRDDEGNLTFEYVCLDISSFSGQAVLLEIGNTPPEAFDKNGNVFFGCLAFCITPEPEYDFPDGWSADSDGINCPDGSDVGYDFNTDIFTVTSTGCYFVTPLGSDQYAFAQYELCGSGEIITQVIDIPANPLGWAGVSIRENNGGGSKKVHLMLNTGNFIRREFRSVTDGPAPVLQFPRMDRTWLKLQRSGNQFSMFASSDGAGWQFMGAVNVSMNNCIHVGLVVTNGNPNSTVTAQFANTQIIQSAGLIPFNTDPELIPFEPVQIFPNPATDRIMVRLRNDVRGSGEIQLFDALGKMIYHNNIDMVDGQVIEIPVHQLPQGWYMARVTGSDGLFHTEKILIKR